LIGGETAEMPEMYGEGEYDLAGTIVGIVARDSILDGSKVQVGDLAYGLPSTGLHTNGYSLARRIVFGTLGLGPDDEIPDTGQSAADALLAVHKTYLPSLDGALAQGLVHALAHITGGGLTDNVPRVLPEGTALAVELGSWPVPPLFTTLHRAGRVPDDDMLRTFNMGVGMVALVSPASAAAFEAELAARGERAWNIGKVVPGDRRVVYGGTLR
jgi:phosphoribosylformylglycinamidine cyclo-ligase